MSRRPRRPDRGWRALSREEKQQRLGDLRQRQQAQIALEVRRLALIG